jgi:glycosyltransferase involved in cell wall biosynthesis
MKMKNQMLISTIIPVRNGERYLAEALESALAQTYPQVEILVVDDGSTDKTAEIAHRYAPIKYIFQPHAGAAAARNRAIPLAKGDFFAFLDADDVWLPDKLALQMAAFNAESNFDIVTGHVQQFISPELDAEGMKGVYCPPDPMPGYIPTAILVKREAFFRVGWFDENYSAEYQMEFLNWCARAVEIDLHIKVLPDLVARRRLHPTNQERSRQSKTEIVSILKDSLDRRRVQTRAK